MQNLNDDHQSAGKDEISPQGASWIRVCIVVAIVSGLYRLLVYEGLEQGAILFIGIPLCLSILLAKTRTPKSPFGVIAKSITLALLLSGILLIEGLVCIIMAAPLFYLVGWIVSIVSSDANRDKTKLNCCVIGVLMLFSLEGLTTSLSFERSEKVVVSQALEMTKEEAMARLAKGPNFNLAEIPMFFKIGFPLPQKISGDGIAVGDEWVIHFAGGEGKPGDLVLEVIESADNYVTYQCLSDESHIAHWMDWKTITWHVTDSTDDKSEISIELEYDRLLDPAWYFKPLERYGVKKAGEYLISQMFN